MKIEASSVIGYFAFLFFFTNSVGASKSVASNRISKEVNAMCFNDTILTKKIDKSQINKVDSLLSKSLPEVVVKSEKTFYKGNKQITIPSKEQLATSSSGYDLLKKLPLPFLNIDEMQHSITSTLPNGAVQIRINNVIANGDDIANLCVEDVKRVEYTQYPSRIYGENLSVLINIVTNKSCEGWSLGTQLLDAITLEKGSNNLFASRIKGNSELSLSYALGFENQSNLISNEQKSFLLPDDSWHNIRYMGMPSRKENYNHNIGLKYNLSVEDKYVFQVQLRTRINKNPQQKYDQSVEEDGKESYSSHTSINNDFHSPSLDLYFYRILHKNQEIIINAVGTYIYSDYNYKYNTNNYRLATQTIGKRYSFIGEAIYSNMMKPFTLTSGIKSYQSYADNVYKGNTNYKVSFNNNDISTFVEIKKNYSKFNYALSTTLNYKHYLQDNTSYDFWTFHPKLSLGYALNSHLRIDYLVNYTPSQPGFSSLNNIELKKNEWEIRKGNPDLKPFRNLSNSLSMAYYTNRLYAQLSSTFNYCRNAIMPTVSRRITEDGNSVYIYSVDNHPSMNQFNIQSYLRYELIPSKLILTGNGGFNVFYCNGNTFETDDSFFFGGTELSAYLGKLYLSAGLESRYISQFAETTWYNAYSNHLNATYNFKKFQVGLRWCYPLQKQGYNSRVRMNNPWVNSLSETICEDEGNIVLLTFSWKWQTKQKSKAKEKRMNNSDTEQGILKNK